MGPFNEFARSPHDPRGAVLGKRKGKCDHQLKRISPNITASKLKTAVRTVDFLQSQSQCVRTLSVKGNILSGQHFLRICF